jgi:putative addiction module component (TIGR02574 family)
MEPKLEEVAPAALSMNVESRAALAKRLLDSLDDLSAEEYEHMWAQEGARRYQQLKAATARSIPSDEVFARLDARSRLPVNLQASARCYACSS